jgi:hypothetical protein
MVSTWPNVQTVRIAIESEARYSRISLTDAANMILEAAQEWTPAGNGYDCPSPLDHADARRANTINRFWFEDARWRGKGSYVLWEEKRRDPKFAARLQGEQSA